jgi:hypothetical protein
VSFQLQDIVGSNVKISPALHGGAEGCLVVLDTSCIGAGGSARVAPSSSSKKAVAANRISHEIGFSCKLRVKLHIFFSAATKRLNFEIAKWTQ